MNLRAILPALFAAFAAAAPVSSQPAAGPPVVDARLLSASVTERDYPRVAARAGAAGTTVLRYNVGRNGRVTDCVVTRSAGTALLDSASCRILRRWRFRAARDAGGHPVDQLWTTSITWSPPRDIRLSQPGPLSPVRPAK